MKKIGKIMFPNLR